MKHRATVFGLIAIFLTTAQPSFARNDKDHGDHRNRDRNEHAQRNDRHDRNDHAQRNDRHDRNDRGHRNDRHDRNDHEARAAQRWHYTGRSYRFDGRDERGAGPNHQFHRGERLSGEYSQRYYVVDDWRDHRLSAPPRGYHWIQAGGDYVLVAIATGIIVDLLLNH